MTEASNGSAVGGDPGRQVLPRLYEEIRSWALDPSREPWTAARHFGWGALVQRGMAAWMESRLGSSSTTTQGAPPMSSSSDPVALTCSADTELALILASLVFGQIQGAGI